MKRNIGVSDREFDAAWRAFAEEDAAMTAPARVEHAVMAAWRAARAEETWRATRAEETPWHAAHVEPPLPHVSRWSGRRAAACVALAATAVLALGTVVIVRRGVTAPPVSTEHLQPHAAFAGAMPVAPSPAMRRPPVEQRPRAVGQAAYHRPSGSAPTRSTAGAPPALMTLAADPILDTESLHIVRVRMPRGALQALGVLLAEPETAGLVDVDVLVGDDGLARDIRRVKAVLTR